MEKFGYAYHSSWGLVLTVAVLERRTISSFSRSAFLTRWSRIRLFPILLLVIAVSAGMDSGSIAVLEEVLDRIPDEEGSLRFWAMSLLYMFLFTLSSHAFGLFCCVFPTVAYVRLREIKEGVDLGGLEEVFR